MFLSKSRFLLLPRSSYNPLALRHIHQPVPVGAGKYGSDQIDYIKSTIENNNVNDWTSVKSKILNIHGSVNHKNVDAILLKMMITHRKFEAAVSFADFLKSREDDLNLGSINGLLGLYYEMGLRNELTDKQKDFILKSYKNLYDKYKVLDCTTCEKLLHALCVINELKKALKVLDDIQLSGNPTHSAYSTIIATFFKLNKKSEAFRVIEKSTNDRRPLKHNAYNEWINYILRKYKDKKTIVKYLDEICVHISSNCVTVSMETATKFRETYSSLGWNAQFTRIRRKNGQCVYCKDTLDCLKLSEEEFTMLQRNVKEKLIIGSDLFLKTSPDELKSFLDFVDKTAPYDIVLDALNISYVCQNRQAKDRMQLLIKVIKHFKEQNKRILLIGRKHMLRWPNIQYLLRETSNFFIENISQDDPYFITAAILSGAGTDIVSKDLLRGHRFQMRDEQLRLMFQRWQWQHQWMVFAGKNGQPIIQAPLPVTPCAQKKNSGWHLPYESADAATAGQVRDGTPDWSSWLCLRPTLVR